MALRRRLLCRVGTKVSTIALLRFPCMVYRNASNDWQDCEDHKQSYGRAHRQRETEDLYFGKYDCFLRKLLFPPCNKQVFKGTILFLQYLRGAFLPLIFRGTDAFSQVFDFSEPTEDFLSILPFLSSRNSHCLPFVCLEPIVIS